MSRPKVELMHGDCLVEMQKIEPGSIDLILADPPYGTIEGADLDGWENRDTSWDVCIDHEQLLDRCNTALRPNGALILFCQDQYTGKLMTETHGNLPFSYRLTWIKDHFANALAAKVAPVSYTEDICVFFKKYDLLNQHPLREYAGKILEYSGRSLKQINEALGHRRAEHFFYVSSTQFGLCTSETYNELIEHYKIDQMPGFMPFEQLEEIDRTFSRTFSRTFNLQYGEKHKPNVLRYKKDYTGHHPTQKPVALMRDLILTYTNRGDTVLDFSMGSGSTGVACINTGRNFIGIELKEKYFDIARKRINHAQEGFF